MTDITLPDMPGLSLRGTCVAFLCALLAGTPPAAGAQQDRTGFYAGLQTGVANASTVSSSLGGANHPTRCDTLLYPPSVNPPAGDAACHDGTLAVISANEFEPAAGTASGLMVGYMLGSLRFEAEYLHRYMGDDSAPVGGTTSAALQGKGSEWSSVVPPGEWIGDYGAHQLFANAYFDFVNGSDWTPYAGIGVGLGRTALSYRGQSFRKPEAEYLQVEFDPDWPDAAKRAAAGTASIIDTRLAETVAGAQLLAGVDYALTERASAGVRVRWARFGDLTENTTWNLVRSHAPVQSDGITPFGASLEFGGIGYQAVTVDLKYRF
ncbi:MAG: outer membrane beta-barrel protein [Gemmatimonadota bacterium]|nr:outer membrane beta-barrel protein [Gemmatimonadota bacterium]